MLAIMAALQIGEEQEMYERRETEKLHKRFIRDMSDPFTVGDEVFRGRYRMYPWAAIELIETLRPHLPDDARAIKPHHQVLAILRFFAEGPYQKGAAADYLSVMTQPTISKYLHIVVNALLRIGGRFIKFPSTREERQIIQQGFQDRLGFPGVIGAVDCTLPKIHAPPEHEEAFVNYKQEHSLCVQAVCDVNYNIMNLRICSGSTNDRFVWRHSEVRQEMLRLRQELLPEEGPYYLLGDSGYTPSRVLLTPINRAARGTPEYNYSDTIRRTRCRIEQTFGIWKQIMRCINGERSLYYAPDFSAHLVSASAVLYNFLRHHSMPLMEAVPHERQVHYHFEDEHEYLLGVQERQMIINNHFNV